MGPKNEQEARQAKALTGIALTALAARAGGIIEIPLEEFEAAVERWGGKGNATMFVEMLEGGGPKRVRVSLVNKKPQQGDLPV